MAPPSPTILVGQSGGPTAVINCTLAGVIEAGRDHRVLGMRHGVEGLLANDLADLSTVSKAGLQRLMRTPSAALGSCRHRLTDDEIELALHRLREHNVAAFLYAGGNDSADSTHRLAQAAARAGLATRFLGLPKTIDNDLPDTDHCPGYGSAARFVALATLEIGTDTMAMRRTDPVRIIEVMGRDAGWLAASAILAKRSEDEAPHLILFPETPLSEREILERVARIHERLGYAVLVMCENQATPDGKVLGATDVPEFTDQFGHAYHASPATFLARRIQSELKLRARQDSLSRLQRSSILLRSSVDVREARDLGRAAVPLALGGATDQMLTLCRTSDRPYTCEVDLTPLEQVANRQRLLPPEYIDEVLGLPSSAFVQYAQPLAGGSLPRHQRFM